jgi:hypothetical protein
MHPDFRELTLRQNRLELERKLRLAQLRPARRPAPSPPAEPLTLRLSGVQDDDALDRLAALEGRPAPKGQHVVAEVAGVVVAALPLGPGSVLADPFRPTAHLLPLLELRARQLADAPRRGRRPAAWVALRSSSGV